MVLFNLNNFIPLSSRGVKPKNKLKVLLASAVVVGSLGLSFGSSIGSPVEGILPSFSPVVVQAEETGYSSVTVNSTAYINDAGALSVFSQIANTRNNEAGIEILDYDAGKQIVIFNTENYESLLLHERKEFMSNVLSDIKGSRSLNAKNKNKLYNFVSSQDSDTAKVLRNLERDVTADIASGNELYLPFQNPVTMVLGLVALGIFIGMGVSIVLDIAYLVLPMVRVSLDNSEGIASRLVSPEAVSTARDVDGMGNGTYMLTYLKRRTWVVALVFIALGYLNSGWIVYVVGNFLQVISNALQ